MNQTTYAISVVAVSTGGYSDYDYILAASLDEAKKIAADIKEEAGAWEVESIQVYGGPKVHTYESYKEWRRGNT